VEEYEGRVNKPTLILDHGNSWKWVHSLTLRPFYCHRKSSRCRLGRRPGETQRRFRCSAEENTLYLSGIESKTKLNSMVWVRERTIPTERPPLVGEVIATGIEPRLSNLYSVTLTKDTCSFSAIQDTLFCYYTVHSYNYNIVVGHDEVNYKVNVKQNVVSIKTS
jgi:hypothetical protein